MHVVLLIAMVILSLAVAGCTSQPSLLQPAKMGACAVSALLIIYVNYSYGENVKKRSGISSGHILPVEG